MRPIFWFDFIGNVENIVTITFLIISKLTQFSAKQNANVWNVPGLLIVSDQDEKNTFDNSASTPPRFSLESQGQLKRTV